MNKTFKQEPDPEAFFEEFGFTKNYSTQHPEFKTYRVDFSGLEADYVSRLERANAELIKHVKELSHRINWLQEKEYRKSFKDLIVSGEGEE